MRNHNRFKNLVLGAALGAVALGTALTGRPAQATPATLGFYPATDIYGPGTFHLDFDSYGRGLRGDASLSTGLEYGFGDTDKAFGRSEIGFDYFFKNGGAPIDSSKRILVNGKTQLFNSTESGTRVVAGVWGLGNTQFGAPNVGYVEGSKTFEFGRVHLGLAKNFAGKVAGVRVTDLGPDDSTFSVSAGFDRYITPKLQFAVDYYSGKNSYAGVQPTLYYYINDKANFGLGLFHLNSSNAAMRNQVYACFDYNFGGNGAAPAPETAPAAKAAN